MTARGTAVIAVSALASPALVRGLVRAGLTGVVAKVDSLDTLVTAIRTVAAGESWTTPELAAALANSTELEMPLLSEQEQQVLILYASGLKIATIARRLGISPHTVKDSGTATVIPTSRALASQTASASRSPRRPSSGSSGFAVPSLTR